MKLLLIDNYEVFREGLAKMLENEPDISLVLTSDATAEVIKAVKRHQPDVVLMEPESYKSMRVISCMRKVMPDLRIIVLTQPKNNADFFYAMNAGAIAYVSKSIKYKSLLKVINLVAEGKVIIDESLARFITDVFQFIHDHMHVKINPDLADSLTCQEKAVLTMLSKGATNKEIASGLVITENTVKVHLRSIMHKLCVHNRFEAGMYAIQCGLAHSMHQSRVEETA